MGKKLEVSGTFLLFLWAEFQLPTPTAYTPTPRTCININNLISLFSSSCGSLSTSEVGPMIVGAPISVDDWVPELPPKKAHLRAAFAPRHIPSPDLPPPSPPPVVDDEVFISDEPLPPPPPEIAPLVSAKKKEISKSVSSACDIKRNSPPDLILSSTAAGKPSQDDDSSQKNISNPPLSVNRLNKCASFDEKSQARRSPPKTPNSVNGAEFPKYSQHLYKDETVAAESKNKIDSSPPQQPTREPFLRPSAAPRNDLVRTQNSEFLKKRSVFADGVSERQSVRYSTTQKLQINGKQAIGCRTAVPNSEIAPANKKYEHGVGTSPFGFENQLRKTDKVTKNAQFSSAVLRHSEKFPAKLDPHCPPTTYQL